MRLISERSGQMPPVGSSIGYVFLAVLLFAVILSGMIAPVMSAVAEIRSARKTAKRRGETEP